MCDYVHSLVERKASQLFPRAISLPEQWRKVIAACRPSHPFKIIEVGESDILNWRSAPYTKNFDMRWSTGVSWRIDKSSLHVLSSYDSVFSQFFNFNSEDAFIPEPSNPSGSPLPFSKLMDLFTFISSGWIPISYLPFYMALPVDATKSEKDARDQRVLQLKKQYSPSHSLQQSL